MIRYWTILHQILPKGQYGSTKSVVVKGMQNMMNSRSAMARLRMSTFVVERMVGLAATTITTNMLPMSPNKKMMPKKIGTTITTTLFTFSQSTSVIFAPPTSFVRFDTVSILSAIFYTSTYIQPSKSSPPTKNIFVSITKIVQRKCFKKMGFSNHSFIFFVRFLFLTVPFFW